MNLNIYSSQFLAFLYFVVTITYAMIFGSENALHLTFSKATLYKNKSPIDHMCMIKLLSDLPNMECKVVSGGMTNLLIVAFNVSQKYLLLHFAYKKNGVIFLNILWIIFLLKKSYSFLVFQIITLLPDDTKYHIIKM